MHRRTVLAGTGILATSALSGCVDFDGLTNDYHHFVSLYNSSERTHTLSVEVFNEDEETLFSQTKTLDPRTADEHLTFPGTPTRLVVDSDSTKPINKPWNMKVCSDTANLSGLDIGIGPPPGTDEPDSDTLDFQWTCQSVQ